MKRDLKLNMSHLDAISRKVQSYIAVRDFLNNSELQGQAFDNLRMQMEDYLMILRTMRAANCSDDTLYLKYHYSKSEQQNLDLALVQGLLYEAWKKKEEKYDAIDNATVKLFTTVGRMDYGQSSKGSKNNEVN